MTPEKFAEYKRRHIAREQYGEMYGDSRSDEHNDCADLLAYVETLTNQLNASQLLARAAADELEKVTKERDEAREAAKEMQFRLSYVVTGPDAGRCMSWARMNAPLPWEV